MAEPFSRIRHFLEELKRRKVFRVAAVYAGTAFVLLQAANLLFPTLNVPRWTFDVLVVLTLFGFPIALVLAWAFEVTPGGIRRSGGSEPEPPDPGEGEPADRSIRTEHRPSPADPAWLGTRTVALVGILVLLGFGLGAGWFAFLVPDAPAGRSEPGRALRVSLLPPPGYEFDGGVEQALSPDGRRLAFVTEGERRRLWIRDLNEVEARSVPGTEGASSPFWSPGGDQVAFIAGRRVRIADLRRGGVRTLTGPVADDEGGDWSPEGILLFTGEDGRIHRVPEAGGKPVAVTERHVERARLPSVLPGGDRFLYSLENAVGVFVGRLDDGPSREILARGGNAAYAAPGWLLYNTPEEESTLFARRFDLDDLEFRDPPFPLVSGLRTPGGDLSYAISESGHLVYLADAGARDDSRERMLIVDRQGTTLDTVARPDSTWQRRWSPTGDRIAFSGFALWVRRLDRPSARRLPEGSSFVKLRPTWAPEDSLLAYWTQPSRASNVSEVWAVRPDGTGSRRLFSSDTFPFMPAAWSPDGRFLLGRVESEATSTSYRPTLYVLDLVQGDISPWAIGMERVGSGADFKPDGRWVAFEAMEGGEPNVFAAPFPGPGGPVRISPAGGSTPRWRTDGRALFFVDPNGRLMVVDVAFPASGPEVSSPRLASPELARFSGTSFPPHPGPDGDRFLVRAAPSVAELQSYLRRQSLTLVVGWTEELGERGE